LTDSTPAILTKCPYLKRRGERTRAAALKKQITFGLLIGWLLTLVGAFYYFLVVGALDGLWLAVMWAGLLLLVVTISCPAALAWPERLWMKLASGIGHVVFSVILGAIYFLFFLPVGRFLRWRKGDHPFYHWDERKPVQPEGWVKKVLPSETIQLRDRKRPLFTQPFLVIGHIARQGHYLFLPALLILLLIGLILFFAQSSALAPFIYTIF